MTLEEWAQVEALVAATWPHAKRMDRDQVRLRHQIVSDLTREQAVDAVTRMAREGREFPPQPPQIAAHVVERARQAAPAVGTVMATLLQAASQFGAGTYVADRRQHEAQVLRWLAERSPHAARFAAEFGWAQFCREGLSDPEYGGAVRQRLERSIQGTISGLEREIREDRLLPLVSDRIRSLEAGGSPVSGLRRMGVGDLLPARPALVAGTVEEAA